MKKFYVNAISFIIVFLLVVIAFDYLSMRGRGRVIIAELTNSLDYITDSVGSDEIKPCIYRAQTDDGTTKLILGDSVCSQMFYGLQEYNDDFSIIGSNGAITMAGQYILAKEYLESHPDATDIFLIVHPDSVGRTFDTLCGYQYTVMPFVETDTLKDLDEETIGIMEKTYGKFFLNPTVVKAIDLSGVNRKLYLNILQEHTSGYSMSNFFELADRYIYKIYELCESRGVSFYFYPSPVSEVKREYVDNLVEAFEESELYKTYPQFLDMVCYFPKEQAVDGTHFSGEYANQKFYNEIILEMYEGSELLDMLKFE